jgi:hypothetical protein
MRDDNNMRPWARALPTWLLITLSYLVLFPVSLGYHIGRAFKEACLDVASDVREIRAVRKKH